MAGKKKAEKKSKKRGLSYEELKKADPVGVACFEAMVGCFVETICEDAKAVSDEEAEGIHKDVADKFRGKRVSRKTQLAVALIERL